MPLFGRRETSTLPPLERAADLHPALASPQAFADAPLADVATAILLAGGLGERDLGRSVHSSEVFERVKLALGPDGRRAFGALALDQVVDEALAALEHSLLIVRHWTTADQALAVRLTRRGRRALDSGDVAAWVHVPAEPSLAARARP
jgi:hypothetical protein